MLLPQVFAGLRRQAALSSHFLDAIQRADQADDLAGTRSIVRDRLMELPPRMRLTVSVRRTPWFPLRREGVMIPGLSWTPRRHRYPIHLSGQAA